VRCRAGSSAAAGRRRAIRVHVDLDRCQGHSRCYALAPEVFDVDDDGFASVLIEGDLPAHLEEKAALAVANCPERAISVED
jgi:ferredoxin